MEVTIQRCAGLDVHKKTVVACVRTPGRSGQKRRSRIRTFSTTMEGLDALRRWLSSRNVTHAAMESTGVYWRPVYAVLEGRFELMLVNARHVKHVPGRKTDARDCEWIAQLLECGLLRGSFIPPPEIRDLRDLTRLRASLVRDRSRQINRVAKTLELANVKLGSVVSDLMGRTARRILDAMIGGTEDPQTLAGLACGSLKNKKEELAEAVVGLVTDHHRFLLRQHLRRIDHLSEQIQQLDTRIEEHTRPFDGIVEIVESVPGIGRTAAYTIVAEIGLDMSAFPTSGHFASWAGVCPGNNESGGKRRRAPSGKGNPWLRSILAQVAWAAVRTKSSYYRGLYYRMKNRGGPKKAIVAVQHAILVAIWHMLSNGAFHHDLGEDHFQRRDTERRRRYHLRQLKRLGVDVQLPDAA